MGFSGQKFVDRGIGGVLSRVYAPIGRTKKRSDHKPILVTKLWALGESILVLPMIKELRKSFPGRKIVVLARRRNVAVFTDCTFIDEVLLFEPEKLVSLLCLRKRFSLGFDCEPFFNVSALLTRFLAEETVGFNHGVRSHLYDHTIPFNDQQHEVLTFLDLLRVLGLSPEEPKALVKLGFSEEQRKQAIKKMKSIGIPLVGSCLIGFAAGSAESAHSRRWPKKKYITLAKKILTQNKKAYIVLLGSASERVYGEEILQKILSPRVFNMVGGTSVKELFALVSFLEVVVSNDSGVMHVAAAQGVKTIGLFCPNTPVRFAPYGPGNVSIYHPVLDAPCINVHKGEVPDCKDHDHMSDISVDEVFFEVKKIMGRKQ